MATRFQKALKKFVRAENIRADAEKEMEKILEPLIARQIATNDYTSALQTVSFMPSCSTKTWFLSRIEAAKYGRPFVG